MSPSRRILAALALGAIGLVPVATAPAEAASVLYTSAGEVWASSLDGRTARLTTDGTPGSPYVWPSADAAGAAVAAKHVGSTRMLWRRSAAGTATIEALKWRAPGFSVNAGPSFMRVRPSGGAIAFAYHWNPGVNQAMVPTMDLVKLPEQSLLARQTRMWSPTWTNDRTVTSDQTNLLLETTPGGWEGWRTSSQADFEYGERSADGSRVLAITVMKTGARERSLNLFAVNGMLWAGCDIPVVGSVTSASLGTDGKTVAWADAQGVKVGRYTGAATGSAQLCVAETAPRLLAAGAVQPAVTAADLVPQPVPDPGEEKPGEEKPGEEKPGEEKPGEEKPGEERPGEEKPGEEKPGGEKPGGEIPPPLPPAPPAGPAVTSQTPAAPQPPRRAPGTPAATVRLATAPSTLKRAALRKGLRLKAATSSAGRIEIALSAGKRTLLRATTSAAAAGTHVLTLKGRTTARGKATLVVTFRPADGSAPVTARRQVRVR